MWSVKGLVSSCIVEAITPNLFVMVNFICS